MWILGSGSARTGPVLAIFTWCHTLLYRVTAIAPFFGLQLSSLLEQNAWKGTSVLLKG